MLRPSRQDREGEHGNTAARMRLDPSTFRRVMRCLAAGVSVATVRGREGGPCGLTVTAVCLVSWDPPLLLLCIDRTAECHSDFLEAEAFAVNLLREDQEDLSRQFAKKDVGKFQGVRWRPGRTGAPVLENVLAHVECHITTRYPGGDHTIILGEAVEAIGTSLGGGKSPLLYFRGRYARLTPASLDDL